MGKHEVADHILDRVQALVERKRAT